MSPLILAQTAVAVLGLGLFAWAFARALVYCYGQKQEESQDYRICQRAHELMSEAERARLDGDRPRPPMSWREAFDRAREEIWERDATRMSRAQQIAVAAGLGVVLFLAAVLARCMGGEA